jgi:CHAD domain-containing protein
MQTNTKKKHKELLRKKLRNRRKKPTNAHLSMISRDKHRRMMEDIYEVPYHEITKEMILKRQKLKRSKGKERQKYVSQERYLEERYQISVGLKGPKRLEGESFEDFHVRRKAENGLVREYLRGVWIKKDDD